MRSIACRIRHLDTQIAVLDTQLDALVLDSASTLLARTGVGAVTAAQLLMTAGQNIDRLSGEAGFARLCGVAPVPVSSG